MRILFELNLNSIPADKQLKDELSNEIKNTLEKNAPEILKNITDYFSMEFTTYAYLQTEEN